MKLIILSLLAVLLFLPSTVLARVTPNDIYQERKAKFEDSLNNISDPIKKEKLVQSQKLLNLINQRVGDRFLEDINKLSAIMEELRTRQGIKETRVAYGSVDTAIENADYWVNWAAEAIAYQKAKEYMPEFSSEAAAINSIKTSSTSLKSDLQVLRGKVMKAKGEVKKALNQYEK